MTLRNETAVRASGSYNNSRLENIRIEDCEVFGFGYNGIVLHRVINLILKNNTIHRIGYSAIACLSCYDALVEGNQITSVTPGAPGTGGDAYGVIFSYQPSEGSAPTVDDPASARCIATANTITNIPTWEALDTHDGAFITFADNIIEGCKIGINATSTEHAATAGVQLRNIVVTGNTVIAAGSVAFQHYGIVVGGRPERYMEGAVIANNIVQGYGIPNDVGSPGNDGAIEVFYSSDVAISGNSIKKYATAAIMLYHQNHSFVCTGNVMDGSGGMDGVDGMRHAVRAYTTENYGIIIGNQTGGWPITVADPTNSIVGDNN